MSMRRLHQKETLVTGARVRIADFSSLPKNVSQEVSVGVPELNLEGKVNFSISDDVTEMYGAYSLGPSQVQRLAQVISDELPLVSPSQAMLSPIDIIHFPGVALRGESVLDTLSTHQPLRIPTVFAPFHAGNVFRVAGREAPPGVTLNFSNMTLLLPNVTYEGIYESGLMDFFYLGLSARLCFTNSFLALKSCGGYTPELYHMWCCTKRQCNILYTQQAIEDLGYDTIDNLEHIRCFAAEVEGESPAAVDEGGVRWAPIAGIVILLLTVLAAVFAWREWTRRHKSNMTKSADGAVLPAVGSTSGSEGTNSEARGSHGPKHAGTGRDTSTRAASAGARTQSTGLTTSMDAVTCTDAYNTAVAAGETTAAQRKARLMAELDHMRHHDEHFLGQFAVLPWTQRREGGQGVVQFMRSTRTEEAVAVKFFLSRSAFDTELSLYQVPVLRSMMPAVRMEVGNVDGAERNDRGYPWPPCIVLEKGESLQEWKAKTQPAFSTILDALCLIAERLAQLHGSGWVHRDLKPGNVLRLPGQHSWTLMDFGCAALAGVPVSLTFSPSYAPPEVAQATERGDRTIVADAAADMWALGVMAFELLTGAALFPPLTSTRETIWAQLCGREALPWEEGAPGQAGKLAQLRALKGAILQCLQRKPEDRPTAQDVLTQWRNLFEPQLMLRWPPGAARG